MGLWARLSLVFLTVFAVPLKAEFHGPRPQSGFSPASPHLTQYNPQSLDAFLEEIAMNTAVQVEWRLREIVKQYQAEGIAFIEMALSRMIEKNLSPKEIAILTAALELAADDQIQEAARGVAQVKKGQRVQAWLNLAQTIETKVTERLNLVPEARAVKILARQTIDLAKLTEEGKLQLRAAQTTFKESLYLMADKKIDGKGVAKLFVASAALTKFAAGESMRDFKTALNPVEAEKSLKAVALLGNTLANADPYSKMVLRDFLSRELENGRIVPKADGTADWPATLERLAVSAPTDTREVAGLMQKTKIISPEQAAMVDRAVTHAEDGQKTLREIATFFQENRLPQNSAEFQQQGLNIQWQVERMRQRGQIGDDVAAGVIRASAAALAGEAAVDAGQRIETLLENSITRRRLGLDTAGRASVDRVTR